MIFIRSYYIRSYLISYEVKKKKKKTGRDRDRDRKTKRDRDRKTNRGRDRKNKQRQRQMVKMRMMMLTMIMMIPATPLKTIQANTCHVNSHHLYKCVVSKHKTFRQKANKPRSHKTDIMIKQTVQLTS